MNNKIYLIGNAHLDPTWLWRWTDGCAEVLQTFRSALDRLNEYNDFVFTCSSACYYRWVEELDPAMFEEIKDMVKAKRWIPVNGWYVQPDCNIPSGESFARQALYSQLYYYNKFGIICRTGYNVDSFGHNGMLPQLLKNGGMSSYVMMRPGMHENSEIPQGVFWWESADGSRVLTYRIPTGYAETGKKSIDRGLDAADSLSESSGLNMMLFYGVGNHGGGPTRWDIEYLKSLEQRDAKPSLKFSSPDAYFNSVKASLTDIPVWRDDLQHHASGCYSATSLIKQLNRECENELYKAETLDTVAAKVCGVAASTADFADAWREICYNQFHDVLCGCSIYEAYIDARNSAGQALNTATKKLNAATIRLSREIDTWLDGVAEPVCSEVRHETPGDAFPRPVVVFNPLSWDITVPVRAYQKSESVTDCFGKPVLCGNVRSSRSNDTHLDTVFLAEVPAMGYATYWLSYNKSDSVHIESDVKCGSSPLFVENEFIRAEFDAKTGGISLLLDKCSGHNYADNGCLGVPTVIDDHKTDTWAHNVFKFHDIKGVMKLDKAELVEDENPVRAVIRLTFSFGKSSLTEDYILASGQKTLRVKCKAIWREDFTMLKLPFDIGGEDSVSTYEIPAGYIKRPCNGEEEPSGKWADITSTFSGKRCGLAIINDSKYSYDCPDTCLRLTALRNVIFADHYSNRPAANFNFTDEGIQRFEFAIYPHCSEAEKSDVSREAYNFNIRPTVVAESYHKGNGKPQRHSFLSIDASNVCVTAFKSCEDGSGDTVIRLYETKGIAETRVKIMCDILNAAFYTDIHANEIKTLRINSDGFVSDVSFLEGIIR